MNFTGRVFLITMINKLINDIFSICTHNDKVNVSIDTMYSLILFNTRNMFTQRGCLVCIMWI